MPWRTQALMAALAAVVCAQGVAAAEMVTRRFGTPPKAAAKASAAPGKAYYAVLTMVDGVSNTAELSGSVSGPVDETPADPVPVLQGQLPKMPFFNYADRRYHYVQWVAGPKLANVPSQYYNWSVGVPEKLSTALEQNAKMEPVPLELTLHRDGHSYWRTQFRIERNSIVLAPHDFPVPTWWYGYHESLGTLKSYRQGVVQPYTERRLLAAIDWAAKKWPADRNKVIVSGCRGGASGTGALHLGLRHPEVFSAVVSGHGSPTWEALSSSTDRRGLSPSSISMQAAFGKPDWALKTDTGKNVYDEHDMIKLVAGLAPTAELPLVTLTSGNKKPVPDFHKVMLEAGRPIMAEFGWGGGRYIPVSATQTSPDVVRIDVRRNAAVLAFCTAEAIKSLEGGMGEFNRDLRWRDTLDTPEKFETTITNLGGVRTSDVTIRRLQQFKPAAGKDCHWSVKTLEAGPADPRARRPDAPAPPPAEGDVTVGDDGLLRIGSVPIPPTARLTITLK